MNNDTTSSDALPAATNDDDVNNNNHVDDQEEETDRGIESQGVVETCNSIISTDNINNKMPEETATTGIQPPALPSITATLLASTRYGLQGQSSPSSSPTTSKSIYSRNDIDLFPQGCYFSPDGLCVLTSQCHRLLLYNTPTEALKFLSTSSTSSSSDAQQQEKTSAVESIPPPSPQSTSPSPSWKPVLDIETGEKIRSYEWYPHMNSSNPASCCFVAASR